MLKVLMIFPGSKPLGEFQDYTTRAVDKSVYKFNQQLVDMTPIHLRGIYQLLKKTEVEKKHYQQIQ